MYLFFELKYSMILFIEKCYHIYIKCISMYNTDLFGVYCNVFIIHIGNFIKCLYFYFIKKKEMSNSS